MTQVTFKNTRGISVTVLLGDTSPVLSDGVVTWDTVARPKRTAITRYTGRNPYKQDIPIMFDGYADGKSQEGNISKLERMATLPNVVNISGHALKTDLDWVFDGAIDWDNQQTIWERIGKDVVRVRQAATVHLLEFIPDTVVETPAAPRVQKNRPAKKIPASKGLTIKQVAQIEYSDPSKWVLIRNANIILLGKGPRSLIPSGVTLEIPEPDGTIAWFTVP
jgi:hypothetical protein